ncbi:competence type IV pilus minor pilin ComGD [Bacillus massiliglaciei]|uniref:competence type IV pilus minor pilin ComGD n=1 Tax=Bacillus massiliglaciei TaxID=1816693 RepID=UPI000DA60C1B|nr:competence type IV pilus minor pilin ComGD [Bacillus massiliglaciei]
MPNKRQSGFTLSEILVVLAVFLMLTSLAAAAYPSFGEELKNEQFIQQFEDDLYYSQQYALSHAETVHFYLSEDQYAVQSNNGKNLLKRSIPPDIAYQKGSLPNKISFTPTGVTSNSGTLQFKTPKNKYKLTIYIGKGKFLLVKV